MRTKIIIFIGKFSSDSHLEFQNGHHKIWLFTISHSTGSQILDFPLYLFHEKSNPIRTPIIAQG